MLRAVLQAELRSLLLRQEARLSWAEQQRHPESLVSTAAPVEGALWRWSSLEMGAGDTDRLMPLEVSALLGNPEF